MPPSDTAQTVTTFLALLLVACATAIVIKWIRVPYAVALVVAGLIIGLSGILPQVSMTPELVLVIFLPALLFEASWNLDLKMLKRDWVPITALATIGVLVCMVAVGAVLHFSGAMDWRTALLFGAMVSATDPISVMALFRQPGIDKRLTMIMEGESIFNDGTAVVLFKIVLALVLTAAPFSLFHSLADFVCVCVGGAVLGACLGYLVSRITANFDDHLLETMLTTLTAYGAYLVADRLHVSFVMAVVAAGIVLGNYGSRTGMSPGTRLAVNSFWEYAAFLGNSLLFLLIGLQVKLPILMSSWKVIALAVLAVVIARLLVVYGICPFVSRPKHPIPMKWRHLLFWGGVRGALVMALALSLPLEVKDRDLIINMSFGVALFTLLGPGLTMEPFMKFLKMAPGKESIARYQECKSQLIACKEELTNLENLRSDKKISFDAYDDWKKSVEDRIAVLEDESKGLKSSLDNVRDRQAKIHLLQARKQFFADLNRKGLLSQDSLHKLNLQVNEELDNLMSKYGEGTQ